MKTLVTMTISACADDQGNEIMQDSTQTHGNDWAEVYRGMIMIRDELNRQLADKKLCPFNPMNVRRSGAPEFND